MPVKADPGLPSSSEILDGARYRVQEALVVSLRGEAEGRVRT